MDRRDEEMRETIRKLWPVQGKKMMDLLMPPSDELDEGKMSVGKIYAGLLISENWKAYKASQNASNNFKMDPVRLPKVSRARAVPPAPSRPRNVEAGCSGPKAETAC
ncbi:voltage-dependent calcium channel type A subunit alpha-1-like isoform X1 [Aplysia californica]|uniref:Voltage-dependent calcium channel type A subunit alpha-1-like isoform X1 n=1 Tax=Aplysia californica TaxID=6500 RepID=A0ABM1VXX8_APLCA|nr:voltage-dependent calcium channel type A subunit alpha-1-like isoform X1 [Aplysia californica]